MSSYYVPGTNVSKFVNSILFVLENTKREDILFLTTEINREEFTLTPIIKIIENKKPKLIIYHLPSECNCHWLTPVDGVINHDMFKLDEILEKIGAKFKIVLGGQNVPLHDGYKKEKSGIRNIEIVYWPTYLITHTWQHLWNHYVLHQGKQNLYKSPIDIYVEKKFDYLYINYNNKARYHRCATMDYLCKNDLLKYGINSWNTLSTKPGILNDISTPYDKYDFECWGEELLNIDNYCADSAQIEEYTKSLLTPNALFSLVTETSAETNYITEKTYRPILIEHPFIAIGGKNQNLELLNLGFELYDEVFDYSFDSKDNLYERIQGIIDNLIKYKDANYYEIYELLEPKIKRNKQRLVDIFCDDPLNPYKEFMDFESLNAPCIKQNLF